jgi:hypothetical protein
VSAGSLLCVVVWLAGALLVCVASPSILSGLWLVVGLFWLVGGFMVCLCGGFALFMGWLLDVFLI